ncbi:MAG: hypothetical protein DRG78_11240 [Epsilonproteobacteria bacterium]|nr:MAG: hypothetical protein DRG78_11240 [Campylobacterota bacterium]
MLLKQNDITILITFYNTNLNYFKDCINSIVNYDCPIIIMDDHSDIEIYNKMFKMVDDLNFKNCKIFRNDKNVNLTENVYIGLCNVKTDYVMRLDSDDVIKFIPTSDKIVDVILKPKNVSSHNEWLNIRKGAHLPGIVFRTYMLKETYSEYKMFQKYEDSIHEDTYHFNRFLKMFPNYTFDRSKKISYNYRSSLSIMKKQKTMTREQIQEKIIELLKDTNVFNKSR